MREAQHRFTQFTVALIREQVEAPRLIIEQYRPDDGLQVSAYPLTVVIELLRDAIDVTRAWMARHQPLDKLTCNEWPNIRMVEDIVERQLQITLWRLTSRYHHSIEQPLLE